MAFIITAPLSTHTPEQQSNKLSCGRSRDKAHRGLYNSLAPLYSYCLTDTVFNLSRSLVVVGCCLLLTRASGSQLTSIVTHLLSHSLSVQYSGSNTVCSSATSLSPPLDNLVLRQYRGPWLIPATQRAAQIGTKIQFLSHLAALERWQYGPTSSTSPSQQLLWLSPRVPSDN